MPEVLARVLLRPTQIGARAPSAREYRCDGRAAAAATTAADAVHCGLGHDVEAIRLCVVRFRGCGRQRWHHGHDETQSVTWSQSYAKRYPVHPNFQQYNNNRPK